jgi:hypothetical protein
VRLRHIDGIRRVERGYGFDVSIDGDDREPGRLWMVGSVMTGLSLPTVELASAETIVATALVKASSNVVPLHPNRRPPNERLH